MLDERYPIHGLDALSRCHESGYFADGHRGAAIISACFLCRENDVDDETATAVANIIDQHWTNTPLCAPFPDEPPSPELLSELVASLQATAGEYREVGHNIIFGSLALKALHHAPHTATPSRLRGLCRMLECFGEPEDIPLGEQDLVVPLDSDERFAEFVLAEAVDTMRRFRGRGQGWTGHLLTIARGIADLRVLGYDNVPGEGARALNQYVKRIRMGPLDSDGQHPERQPTASTPLQAPYWRSRHGAGIGLGHCFKYPYGFYGLRDCVSDEFVDRANVDSLLRVL